LWHAVRLNLAMRTVTLLCVLTGSIAAQSPGDPLTLVRIVRKHISPRSPIQPYLNARPPAVVIGMRSVTGNSQIWLLEAHGSYGSIETTDQALAKVYSSGDAEDELVAPAESLIALFRHGLSYRPDEAVKLMPEARYMQVSVYRSRPGFDVDFAELMRLRKALLDSFNADRPELGYQVISGATTGTFVFITPLTSLRSLDEAVTRWLNQRDGGPVGGRLGREIKAEGDITREQLLFRVEPGWKWSPER
jgi:hypothetical protein